MPNKNFYLHLLLMQILLIQKNDEFKFFRKGKIDKHLNTFLSFLIFLLLMGNNILNCMVQWLLHLQNLLIMNALQNEVVHHKNHLKHL